MKLLRCVLIVLLIACHVGMPLAARQTTDLPLGVGFVTPRFSSLETLRLYGAPELNQLADMATPADSVTFTRGAYHIEIATAPPYLVPEVLKLDYDLLFFRAVTLSSNWIEVVVNSVTGQTKWVDRHVVDFVHWSDFLINVFAVEVIDVASNPVRLKPMDSASIVVDSTGPLIPLAVRGSWIQVSTSMPGEAAGPVGWIRWRNGDRLLISYSLLS